MAQAVVDLPDQPEPVADSLAKTDELLSEMVGNDIDRLLADAAADAQIPASEVAPALTPPLALSPIPEPAAKTEAPPIAEPVVEAAASAPAPAVKNAAPSDEETLTAQLDSLFNELQEEAAPAAAEADEPEPQAKVEAAESETPQEPKSEAATSGEEKAALLENAATASASPAATTAPNTPAADSAANSPAPTSIAASPDPVHETAPSGSERSAMLAAAGFDPNPNAPALEVGPMIKPSSDETGLIGDNAPLPFYLKPLEWINAPLKNCPVAFRQSMGQAALVTLAFAIAVLAWVATHPRH